MGRAQVTARCLQGNEGGSRVGVRRRPWRACPPLLAVKTRHAGGPQRLQKARKLLLPSTLWRSPALLASGSESGEAPSRCPA